MAETIKCRCGFDSGVLPKGTSINVGEEQRRTGMMFVFLADGESAWICKTCNAKVVECVRQVNAIVGSTYWSPSSFSR